MIKKYKLIQDLPFPYIGLKDSEVSTFEDETLIIDPIKFNPDNYPKYFKLIEPIISPLFQTKDGVDVYVGDVVYATNNSGGKFTLVANKYHTAVNVKNYNIFSTYDLRAEFILLNSKLLSIKDVQDIYVSAKIHPVRCSKNDYLQKLKNKANNYLKTIT